MQKSANQNRVIVLGIDALDYSIVKDLMKKGLLPNLSRLAEMGSFSPLAATNPSESAVAWNSFATGLNPANHGVFDFVMRNPSNYSLYLALNEITTAAGQTKVNLYRKGKTLWNLLSEKNIPNYFYFCPNTFPAEPLKGNMLSGMGTPDLSGNMGRYIFYTSKELTQNDPESRGTIIQVAAINNIINTQVVGPKISRADFVDSLKEPIKITLFPKENEILIYLQGQKITLKAGLWSNWCKISFSTGPFKKLHGIFKFYLTSLSPDFKLYLSPINFDPAQPLYPISYPHNYSKKLSAKTGPYHTQGMPHDTWALSDGRIDEQAFLEHVDDIFTERKKILDSGLNNFKGGLFFFYFDTLDVVQHMFWRYTDPQSPLYEKNSPYKDTTVNYYKKIDALVGEILKNSKPDTTILVISDHGFSSFRESVHLNRWLLENGYLVLEKGKTETKDFLEGIDWTKTKAYAIGFGGIYLNKVGRESEGIVGEAEVAALKLKIREGLLKLKNSKGQPAINNVYTQEEAFAGRYSNDAPDLFVGFAKGFRASWQTALGGVPAKLIEANKRKWSGDHLIDPVLVPGVIFINKKINLKSPSMVDIAPTLLHLFNYDKKEKMDGKSLI